MKFKIIYQPKGTFVNLSVGDGRVFCGHGKFGNRRKAAAESFMTAVDSARHFGAAVSEVEVFNALLLIRTLKGAGVYEVASY